VSDREPTPPPELPEDGPTELVEGRDGELVERLSGGTATLLLIWLIGIGAGSALLAAWLFSALFLATRLGAGDLFGAPGLYVAMYGATGPTLLWLTGRAQGHSFRWFALTAIRIGAVMIGIVLAGVALVAVAMGFGLGPGAPAAAGVLIGLTVALALFWALATWSADRYIASARVVSGPDQTS
jgi:hypothetical protein